MVHGKHEAKIALVGGVVAGSIGAIFNDLMMIVGGLAKHEDFWGHMKFASFPFLGQRAAQPGFDAAAVLAGVLCNFLISAIWGVLFGLLVYGLARGATVVAGLLWGLVVWIGMFHVVLPLVGLAHATHSTPVGQAILTHVLFGLVLALAFLPFQVRHGRADVSRPVLS